MRPINVNEYKTTKKAGVVDTAIGDLATSMERGLC